MKDVIHREVLEMAGYQGLKIAGLKEILSFGVQYDKLCMWYLRDADEPRNRTARIRIFGTGFTFESSTLQGYDFQGTHQMQDGALIWHVFTQVEK